MFNSGFNGGYEELRAYSPFYYRGVLEAEAIWRTQGALIDVLLSDIGKLYANAYLSSISGNLLVRLEAFLRLFPDSGAKLDERRETLHRVISTQKINLTWIRDIVQKYVPKTNCEVTLEAIDGTDMLQLLVVIYLFSKQNFLDDILVQKITSAIPAHLQLNITIQSEPSFEIPVASWTSSGERIDITESE
ncbi:MAG: hypothetical protein LBT21_06230 [Oscillospiraceae bacterium]|jgi:hypothetical protein|nr:hypothetical protein [Oscillospiraceae bacterium]